MVRKTVQSKFDSSFLASVNGIVKDVHHHKANNIRLTPKLNQYYAKDAQKQGYDDESPHRLIGMETKLGLPPGGARKLPTVPAPGIVPTNLQEVDEEIADLKSYEQPKLAQSKPVAALVEENPIHVLSEPAGVEKPWEAGGKRKSKFIQFLEENPVEEKIPEVMERKSSGKLAAFLNRQAGGEVQPREEETKSTSPVLSTLDKLEIEDAAKSEDEDEDEIESVASDEIERPEPIRRVPEIKKEVSGRSRRSNPQLLNDGEIYEHGATRSIAEMKKEASARRKLSMPRVLIHQNETYEAKRAQGSQKRRIAMPRVSNVERERVSVKQESAVALIQNWFNTVMLFFLTMFNFLKDLVLGKNELRLVKEKTRTRDRPQSGRRSDAKKILRLR